MRASLSRATGRLFLWTHTATGGGLTFVQHCFRAARKPSGVFGLAVFVLFFAFGPVVFDIEIVEATIALLSLLAFSLLVLILQWLFESASMMARTSVRQFDACDLSCVRLLCYSHKSLWGLGGEITSCHVHMFFGPYPKPADFRRAMPWRAYDSGAVCASAPLIGETMNDTVNKRLKEASGQGIGSSENQLTGIGAALCILLAFAAFLNELTDFWVSTIRCVAENEHQAPKVIGKCISQHFRDWWTGSSGSNLQTIAAHWIDATDWTIQLLLFFYVVGPAVATIWQTMSDHSGAGISFVVDRRRGAAIEDEKFEEHWQEVADFITELFQRGSATPPEAVNRLPGGMRVGGNHLGTWWDELDGDVETPTPNGNHGKTDSPGQSSSDFHGKKRASWAQVEEMTSRLIDPLTQKVNVYKSVLSWMDGERVLAAYPERPRMTLAVKVKICITCGIDYFLHWRRQRRESAIVLTDRRLIQASAHSSQNRRSLKVDMFGISGNVKYLSFNPPRRQCCRAPMGYIALANRCGTLQLKLARMRTRQQCAQQLWQGLTLLQDAPPLTSTEFGSWASALTTEEEEQTEEAGTEEPLHGAALEEARTSEALQEAFAMWGRPSKMGLVAADDAPEAAPAAEAAADDATGGQALAQPAPEPRPSLSSTREQRPSNHSRDSQRQSGNFLHSVWSPEILSFNVKNEPWGLALDEGEHALWGPTLFEEEIWRARCCKCRRRNFCLPSTLVTITTRRLAVVQFSNVGPLVCRGCCMRSQVSSVSVVPLRWVLGFCVEEVFAVQRAMLSRILGDLCCWPSNESNLVVKVLTNAGLGKVYLKSLFIHQRSLPHGPNPQSTFEEDKVLELRRWLGNVGLFFVDFDDPARRRNAVELWRCSHGWAPA